MSDHDDAQSLAQDFLDAYEANPREEIERALAEQREGIAKAIEGQETFPTCRCEYCTECAAHRAHKETIELAAKTARAFRPGVES